MENELAIRRLIAAYSDAVWRRDRDAYAATWAEDGEWKLLGFATTGREKIADFLMEFTSNFERSWQMCHTLLLDIGETRGTGRIYVNELVTPVGQPTQTSLGIYHDEYVKANGEWLFFRRHFDLVYMGPWDFSGRFFPTVPYGKGTVDPDPSRPGTPHFSEVGF